MADNVPMSQAATTSLVTTLQNTDLFALAREDITSETGYRSKVSRVDTMAKKTAKETDYSDLQTTSKNLIGAINEVNTKASQFDNMTATASGSIATFTDGGDDIPVSEYECEIVAQQASGTPTPDNPLPITGFSQADIVVCGKNLFNSALEQGTINSSTGGITPSTTRCVNTDLIPIPQGNSRLSSNKNIYEVAYFDNAKNFVTTTFFNTSVAVLNTSYAYFRISIRNEDNSTILPTDIEIQLELGTTATTYEPYKGNTYIVEFGQTIYGGKLVYKNGQWSIEATYAITTINNNWSMYSTYFYKVFNDKVEPEIGDTDNYLLCSMLPYSGVKQYAIQIPNETIGQSNNKNIYIIDNSCADINAFHAKYNGATIIYPLETPVIIPITSSTRVKTISGDNNIFSNTGDNTVKYFTENADSLAELIKAFVL